MPGFPPRSLRPLRRRRHWQAPGGGVRGELSKTAARMHDRPLEFIAAALALLARRSCGALRGFARRERSDEGSEHRGAKGNAEGKGEGPMFDPSSPRVDGSEPPASDGRHFFLSPPRRGSASLLPLAASPSGGSRAATPRAALLSPSRPSALSRLGGGSENDADGGPGLPAPAVASPLRRGALRTGVEGALRRGHGSTPSIPFGPVTVLSPGLGLPPARSSTGDWRPAAERPATVAGGTPRHAPAPPRPARHTVSGASPVAESFQGEAQQERLAAGLGPAAPAHLSAPSSDSMNAEPHDLLGTGESAGSEAAAREDGGAGEGSQAHGEPHASDRSLAAWAANDAGASARAAAGGEGDASVPWPHLHVRTSRRSRAEGPPRGSSARRSLAAALDEPAGAPAPPPAEKGCPPKPSFRSAFLRANLTEDAMEEPSPGSLGGEAKRSAAAANDDDDDDDAREEKLEAEALEVFRERVFENRRQVVARAASVAAVYVVWVVMVWFIWTYGLLIWTLMGERTEDEFVRSWGLGCVRPGTGLRRLL